jgi:hypothetical protein
MKSFGQVAYEAYRASTDGKSLATGAPIPEWDGLRVEIQSAWEKAADAAVEAARRRRLRGRMV